MFKKVFGNKKSNKNNNNSPIRVELSLNSSTNSTEHTNITNNNTNNNQDQEDDEQNNVILDEIFSLDSIPHSFISFLQNELKKQKKFSNDDEVVLESLIEV